MNLGPFPVFMYVLCIHLMSIFNRTIQEALISFHVCDFELFSIVIKPVFPSFPVSNLIVIYFLYYKATYHVRTYYHMKIKSKCYYSFILF